MVRQSTVLEYDGSSRTAFYANTKIMGDFDLKSVRQVDAYKSNVCIEYKKNFKLIALISYMK